MWVGFGSFTLGCVKPELSHGVMDPRSGLGPSNVGLRSLLGYKTTVETTNLELSSRKGNTGVHVLLKEHVQVYDYGPSQSHPSNTLSYCITTCNLERPKRDQNAVWLLEPLNFELGAVSTLTIRLSEKNHYW